LPASSATNRELAGQQALEDRESWAADRRAAAADNVATLLLEATEDMRFGDEQDWVERLRQTAPPPEDSIHAFINTKRIPGMKKLRKAKEVARLRLRLDGTISDLESELAGRWYVSLRLLQDPALARLSSAEVTTVVHRVMWAGLNDSCRTPLIAFGQALCRWDGRGDPPGRATLGAWEPSAGGTVPPEEPHLSKLLDEQRVRLAKLIDVLGY
jgi:hypothetical protein